MGSVDAITNESGSVVQRLSYDAFGKRRNATTWSGALLGGDWANIAAITHRGFTFHEALDNVDLVHMNGRVYDPDLGRFISADPFIQAPLMSQSLNRYSYVMNNPLSLIDPSGYSWLSKAFRSARKFVKKYWREIVAVAVAYFTGYYAYLGAGGSGLGAAVAAGASAGATYGATATALYGGNLRQVLRSAAAGGIAGGISAAIGYGIGNMFSPATGAGDAPVDFGWKSMGPGMGRDGPLANAANTGINPSVLRGIDAARRTGGGTMLAGAAALPIAGRTTARNPYVFGGAAVIGGSLYAVLNYSRTAGFLRRPDYMSGPEYVPPTSPNADGVSPGDPNQHDPGRDRSAQALQIDNSQLGRKFGEHMDSNLPGYRTHSEYRALAQDIYGNPAARVTRYTTGHYAGETHYQVGSNLLRIGPDGTFRSLYPLQP